ncbi:MAG: chromosome partitioning protein ParB, partial [Patulibacter sp.]|nr:chromosome partitioning protein ParB [Patulibacter sp.]
GVLSEGHGRALLLADGHDARRQLAASAAAEGWSVRVLEARAREAHGGTRSKPSRPAVSTDHSAAAETLGDRWSRGLGRDVRVRPKGEGFVVEIRLEDVGQAERLTDRLGL